MRVFDCHSDVLFDLWDKKEKGYKDTFTNTHAKQLNNSAICASIWNMYSEFDFDLVKACKIALDEIDMTKVKDFKVILGLEGLRNLKNVEDIDELYDMGFRHAMVTWNEENKYATGAKSNPERGFTDEGRRLLKRMQDKGMIIDLAHLNEKSFWDALEVVDKKLMFSHGCCKKYCDHLRNITDDQMRALKEKDGIFGLTLADSFIAPDKKDRTMETFMKHVKHAIDIMGVDNVCFGFDFMDYLLDSSPNLKDLKTAEEADKLYDALKGIGLNDEEIDKVCYTNIYNRFKDDIVLRSK